MALAAEVHCCGHCYCCRPVYDTTYCCCPKSVVLLATVVVTVVQVQNRRNYAKIVDVGISAAATAAAEF